MQRTKGDVPQAVKRLLPRLRDETQTEVIIVTLPEATPVFEAGRLRSDLNRAGIRSKWWVVNQCLSVVDTTNSVLMARGKAERAWLEKIAQISAGHFAAIPWLEDASLEKIINSRAILK